MCLKHNKLPPEIRQPQSFNSIFDRESLSAINKKTVMEHNITKYNWKLYSREKKR